MEFRGIFFKSLYDNIKSFVFIEIRSAIERTSIYFDAHMLTIFINLTTILISSCVFHIQKHDFSEKENTARNHGNCMRIFIVLQ